MSVKAAASHWPQETFRRVSFEAGLGNIFELTKDQRYLSDTAMISAAVH
jgi:hypothetical protein